MTLILDLGLDVLKIYLFTKNKVCRSRFFKVRVRIEQRYAFCFCDSNRDLMILLYELDLNILKCIKNEKKIKK